MKNFCFDGKGYLCTLYVNRILSMLEMLFLIPDTIAITIHDPENKFKNFYSSKNQSQETSRQNFKTKRNNPFLLLECFCILTYNI